MKRLPSRIAAFAALTLALALSADAAKLVNRTIATANGEPILLSEFQKNWEAFKEQQKNLLPAEQMTPQWEKEAKAKILDQMVTDKLLLQEAKKQKVRVNQRDLENGVLQVKSRFLPEAARRDLENIIQRQLANRPPEENNADISGGVDLKAAWQEVAKNNPDAMKEADSKFREELAKEGLTDKKFEERIKDQLSVVQLTSQEVRQRTKAPTDQEARALFEQVQQVMQGKEVKGLDPETAADLDSMAKFFANQTGERVRARHILVRVPQDADLKVKSQARKKLEDIRKRIVAGSDFAEAAQKFSDDKASAVQGGDLGVFTRGQMVPAFEKAAFSLPVGQVSNIVETPFGYHIIQVEEKKAAAKIRYEDVQNDLKEYIYRSNAQGHFEDYVRNLRQNSKVKLDVNLDEIK